MACPVCSFPTTIKVTAITLDEWAEATLDLDRPVRLMWIDVQGAEGRVFRGGRETLGRTEWIKAECHPTELYAGQLTEAAMFAMLPGWECVGRYGDDLLMHNSAFGHV